MQSGTSRHLDKVFEELSLDRWTLHGLRMLAEVDGGAKYRQRDEAAVEKAGSVGLLGPQSSNAPVAPAAPTPAEIEAARSLLQAAGAAVTCGDENPTQHTGIIADYIAMFMICSYAATTLSRAVNAARMAMSASSYAMTVP
jgi:hypothetical protein